MDLERVDAAGDLTLEADLRALEIAAFQEGNTSLDVAGVFLAEADFQQSTAVGVFFAETDNGTIEHANESATFVAGHFGQSYRVFISPLGQAERAPSLTISTTGIQGIASPHDAVRALDPVQVRPEEHVDVSQTLHFREAERMEVVVDAPFRMRLWDVAGQLTTADSTDEVYSGERFEPVAPVNGSEPVARQGEARLLILDVRQGQARLDVPGGNVYALYTGGAFAEVRGQVRGFADSSQTPTYESDGNLSFGMNAGADKVALRLEPASRSPNLVPPANATSDGGQGSSPKSAVSPLAGEPADRTSWWMWITAVSILAILVARVLRQRLLAHRFDALKRDYMRDDYYAVVGEVRPLLRSRRHRLDAGTMAIVAAARVGMTDASIELFGRVQRFAEAEPEGLDSLAACIASARGDTETAAEIIAGQRGPNRPGAEQPSVESESLRAANPGYEGYA